MRVLNPLFDSVFKYLLEDLEVAKTLIQAIIKKEILELTPAPQEASDIELKIKYSQIGMIRQDYVAIIKTTTPSGTAEHEKVIIEVQKSPIKPEIGRFRNYLSDKYRRKSSTGSEEKYLPIKTIYLIEETFNDNLPAVCSRKGEYFDELENKPYKGERDTMIELFNHDSWFIQTELLPPDFKEDLMYILSVFAPWFRKSPKDRFIEIPDEEMLIHKHRILERIFRRLQAATQDSKVNTSLDAEMDYEDYIERMIHEKEKAEKEKIEALAKSEQDRKEKAEAQQRENEAQQREAEALAKSEQDRKEKTEAMRKLATKMKKYGEPIEDIVKETGLSREEIENL